MCLGYQNFVVHQVRHVLLVGGDDHRATSKALAADPHIVIGTIVLFFVTFSNPFIS